VADKITVVMHRKKETKGAVMYEEPGFPTPGQYHIGTLYVRKSDASIAAAPSIRVTVEPVQ
jgi:hypothetical protein